VIFAIYKMPPSTQNYFRYFASDAASNAWGFGVTACGFTVVAAGSTYPPARHPADHDFDWEHGRRLKVLQIVFISAGTGWFESRQTGRRKISPGSAFAVLPGVWHRYRPDPRTGWIESWIEVSGPTLRRLQRSGVFNAASALQRDSERSGLGVALEGVHARARAAGSGFDPELSARAMGVLAAWARIRDTDSEPTAAIRAVIEAERYLSANHTQAVSIAALAERSGIAYSHFRRLFRRHTGFAPWAYVMRLRLVRARRMLSERNTKLSEIAEQLGFSSAFHLSLAFKKAFGQSPDRWRRRRQP